MKKITENKRIGIKPKKLSLKGKQILVGGLVVMVAVAGYYRFSVGNLGLDNPEETAVPVMATADTEDYFTKAKKDRDTARSEAKARLTEITEDESATADAKAEAGKKLKDSAEAIKKEGEIENLINAKGYKDSIVFIDEKEIRVIVKADELDKKKVSQIADIITSKTEFKPSEIIISNHK